MPMHFRPRWTAVVLAACLCSGFSIFADDAADDSDASAPDVATETVEQGPFRVEITLEGVFEAAESVEVKVETEEWTSLEVIEAVPHGSMVQEGDLLIQFATDDLDDEIAKATSDVESGQLAIDAAQLDLQLNEHTLPLERESAERSLAEAREDLEYYYAVGEQQTIRSSEISVKSSLANLESAQEELEQLEQMYLADDLTEETEEIILKRARQDVEFSRFYYESSVISHEELMEYDLERRRTQMESSLRRAEIETALVGKRLETTLAEDRIALRQLELTQEQTVERLTNLQNDRALLSVHAEASGRVIYGECNRGKWTGTSTMLESLQPEGTPATDEVLMTIIVPGALFVRTDVSEAELRHVVTPQQVRVVPAVAPDQEWMANLRTCDPIAIGDDVYDATFEVEIGDLPVEILPGMTCEVIVTARFNPEALTLPSSVIFDDELQPGRKVVYVSTESGHEAREVVVGLSNDDRTEILDGVRAGDTVLSEKP